MFGLTGQEITWIIIAVLALVVIALVLRFFASVAVELLRVGLVVGAILIVGVLLWLVFWR